MRTRTTGEDRDTSAAADPDEYLPSDVSRMSGRGRSSRSSPVDDRLVVV
jgi:hypothetical protein